MSLIDKDHRANTVTVVRLILSVGLLPLILSGNQVLALGIFIVLASTDCVDGALARSKHGKITDVGKWLDPLADKLLVLLPLVAICIVTANGWIVAATIVIAVREFGVMWLRRRLHTRHSQAMPADRLGKVKAVFQMIAVGLILFSQVVSPLWIQYSANALLAVAVILTVLSGLHYLNAVFAAKR